MDKIEHKYEYRKFKFDEYLTNNVELSKNKKIAKYLGYYGG